MGTAKSTISTAGAPPVVSPATPASSVPTNPVHDPYRRAMDLLQRLAPGKMRIGFFLGAGCPLAVQISAGGKSEPIIPEIWGLTAQVKTHLDADAALKAVAQSAWDRVIARGIPTPTIEDVLSHIRTLKSICGKGDIDGFSSDLLGKLDRAICEKVRGVKGGVKPGQCGGVKAGQLMAVSL